MPVAVLDDSDERFQLGDSSEGSMAQLNPTSDTDTTAAIDSGAETSKINPQTPPLRGALPPTTASTPWPRRALYVHGAYLSHILSDLSHDLGSTVAARAYAVDSYPGDTTHVTATFRSRAAAEDHQQLALAVAAQRSASGR